MSTPESSRRSQPETSPGLAVDPKERSAPEVGRAPRTSQGAAATVAVERREDPPLGSEERRRISGLLHDEVQQLLFGIRLKVSLIRGRLRAGGVAAIEDDLDDIDDWAEEAIDAVRGVTTLLRPEPGE